MPCGEDDDPFGMGGQACVSMDCVDSVDSVVGSRDLAIERACTGGCVLVVGEFDGGRSLRYGGLLLRGPAPMGNCPCGGLPLWAHALARACPCGGLPLWAHTLARACLWGAGAKSGWCWHTSSSQVWRLA